MKLATSIRNAQFVADRLRSVNGIIATPGCDVSCISVRRAWLFGSTAKGKALPNDTDIILDFRYVEPTPRLYTRMGNLSGYFRVDKAFYRAHGALIPRSALYEAACFLRGTKKMIRIHDWMLDSSCAETRVMIYPRNDLATLSGV